MAERFDSSTSDSLSTARLAHLAVNQEGFVFDPRTGESYLINATGLSIVRGLQQGRSQAELVDDLAGQFDVAEGAARSDVGDFISQLRHLQLL